MGQKVIQLEKNECYAIYDGITHKPLEGAMSATAANMARKYLKQHGELYAVVNKRNAYPIKRFLPKDEADGFASGYGGCEVVRENIYLAQSTSKRRTAHVVKGDTTQVILAPKSGEFADKVKAYGVDGKRDEKRSIGSYTSDTNEMNYVKGYQYGSFKSPILEAHNRKQKPKSYKRPIPTNKSIFEAGLQYIRRNRESVTLYGVCKSMPAMGMSNSQRKTLGKRIIADARRKGIIK